MTDTKFEIDASCIDGEGVFESRLATLDEISQGELRHVLRYLFATDGPKSVDRTVKARVETHLTTVERFVLQWLHKRTDGKLRRHYGPRVLDAVKRARYRCERCGYRDVRALNLEKVEIADTVDEAAFACVCANCNTVAARTKEMAALALEKEKAAQVAKVALVQAELDSTDPSAAD